MITIDYHPVESFVKSTNRREQRDAHTLLAEELSYEVPGYFFSEQYALGMWDGRKAFFKEGTGRFLSGLLARVLKILKGAEFEVNVAGYPAPNPLWESLSEITLYDDKKGEIALYDYQLLAVIQTLKYNRGILRIATNGGKTEVLAAILKVLGTPPAILYVPRTDLLHQTVERLQERLRVDIGKVGDSVWKPNFTGVTVAMHQTLNRRKNETSVKRWLGAVRIALADECHMLSDSEYQAAFKATKAPLRIGVSGTPTDKGEIETANVVGLCGPVLCTVKNKELIHRGISVKPKVVFLQPNVPRNEAILSEHQSWDYALHGCKARNWLIANIARGFLSLGMQTMIMVSKAEHGKAIQRFIPEAVLAHSNTGNRKQVIKRLQSGEVFCCIATPIFDTGLSVDHIEALLQAAGGKSIVSLLQRLGRGLRQSKSKPKQLWCVDFWDLFNRHTRAHSRIRWDVYKKEDAFDMMEDVNMLPQEVVSHIMEGAGVGFLAVRKKRLPSNTRARQ